MDSQNIKHRPPQDTTTTRKDTMRSSSSSRGNKKMAMAKRGMRSLAMAVSVPLSLTLFNIYFFGSKNGYNTTNNNKPIWFPPIWALHLTCMVSSFLMGLSAWLVWAEGGFHKKPTALSFYLAQLALSWVWDPIVFWIRAPWVGLVVSLAMFAALLGCCRLFKQVNPIAGDLVKPCLAWAAFLAILNVKLVFL
ncbi:TSPO(outer membrane tryptophan-rich sensory protein)-related [Euphorbia peplus]|nr:TSPO(outer membrane tryptophan-rich sensory protein)-related [Euphorbia peplus]